MNRDKGKAHTGTEYNLVGINYFLIHDQVKWSDKSEKNCEKSCVFLFPSTVTRSLEKTVEKLRTAYTKCVT